MNGRGASNEFFDHTGLPNSAGHYLDVSPILGCTFLPLGFLAIVLTRRKNSK
jgi:hypothetical protein